MKLGRICALSALALAGPLDLPAAQELVVVGAQGAELPPGTVAVGLMQVDSFAARLERDRAIAFTLGSATSALEQLESLSAHERAAAWVAIGAAKHLPSRPILRERAQVGVEVERLGAVLGLASYGGGDEALFETLARSGDVGVSGCAVLALALCSSTAGREALARILAEVPELADDVHGALQLATDPSSAGEDPNVSLWLELRWLAARRWGFVAGTRWEQVLIDALCSSDRFLEEVILPSATRAKGTGVRDHMMQHLLVTGGRHATQAVADAMQADLARVIRHGLWSPRDRGEWDVLFDEIERERPHNDVVQLLRTAIDLPDVGTRAALLWIGTGDSAAEEYVERYSTSEEPRLRQELARALGATGDKKWIAELSRMRLDSNPRVRTDALVAQARLGHSPAVERLRSVFADSGSNERSRAVALLADLAFAKSLQPFIAEFIESVEGEERLLLATRLLEEGVAISRPVVFEALSAGLSSGLDGDLAPRMVRSLAVGAGTSEVALLRSMFPVEGAFELNVELARALVRLKDPEILPVLQAALWRGPWHRAQLASALFVSLRGIRGLTAELEAPPAGTGERARRRVGFALGELGGFAEVEELARRRRSGDPALQGAYLGALAARTH